MSLLQSSLHILSWLLVSSLLLSSTKAANSKPGCQKNCGNLTIPYPFGIGEGCSLSEEFSITCNNSYNPPRPYLRLKELHEVVDVSKYELRIKNKVAYACYNESHPVNTNEILSYTPIDLSNTPFTFSDTANMFKLIGCNSMALVVGPNMSLTGCISICNNTKDVDSGSCSSSGCCQTPIPKQLQSSRSLLMNAYNDSKSWNFNPCTYAFIVDQDSYTFDASDLYGHLDSLEKFKNTSLVLDWEIGNQTCQEAKKNLGTYICQGNSLCNSTYRGYRCSCKPGYEGNPYLSPGCADINECTNLKICEGKCKNLPGSYQCIPENAGFPIKEALGLGFSLFFVVVATPGLYFFIKKRKLIKLRERFFQQNGGLLLQQQIACQEDSTGSQKLFTAQELEKASDNYAESRIIGRGGHGTVYKGLLPKNKVVAIKKSKIVDQSQIEQFINEVVILTQINHRNVVKLLGCCLETEVPLLVYEFVPNCNLYDHIHSHDDVHFLSWEIRLRIAAETASALAYLHSATSMPIIHRDVKSANILLDNNYTAKVSDFGASRFIPLDESQLTTLVQGTLGYLDPEYFLTSKLTEKSDVYSFGVVLLELLTGEKPLSFERSETERSLSSYFILSMQQNRLFQIIEVQIATEDNREQIIAVAELAERCLRLKGCDRPTMKQVAMELEKLTSFQRHPWEQADHEEILGLLDEHAPMDLYPIGNSSFNPYDGASSSGHCNAINSMISDITLPR